MNDQQKGKLIGEIISELKFTAKNQGKAFSEGDTFFALAFKSDDELKKIARMCGISAQ